MAVMVDIGVRAGRVGEGGEGEREGRGEWEGESGRVGGGEGGVVNKFRPHYPLVSCRYRLRSCHTPLQGGSEVDIRLPWWT